MVTVWLGLGSNMGNRPDQIARAVDDLGALVSGIRQGRLYETAPMEVTDQADFLNTVITGETDLSARELIYGIQDIERRGGRDRVSGIPKGPRTIDIDILLLGGRVFSETYDERVSLTVPHPAMHERLFVLKPLLDLSPDLKDPRDGVRWASKASHLRGQRVKLYAT